MHVEPVIQQVKTFQILPNEIPINLIRHVDMIFWLHAVH